MKVSNLNGSHNSFRDNRLRTCKACINIQKRKKEKEEQIYSLKKKEKRGERRTNQYRLLGAEPLLPDPLTSPRILGKNIRQVEEKVKDQWQSG